MVYVDYLRYGLRNVELYKAILDQLPAKQTEVSKLRGFARFMLERMSHFKIAKNWNYRKSCSFCRRKAPKLWNKAIIKRRVAVFVRLFLGTQVNVYLVGG